MRKTRIIMNIITILSWLIVFCISMVDNNLSYANSSSYTETQGKENLSDTICVSSCNSISTILNEIEDFRDNTCIASENTSEETEPIDIKNFLEAVGSCYTTFDNIVVNTNNIVEKEIEEEKRKSKDVKKDGDGEEDVSSKNKENTSKEEEVSRKVTFNSGSRSINSIPEYHDGQAIGYLTYGKIGIYREQIILGWFQNACDTNQIIMSNVRERYFGNEWITQLCGHNTGLLSVLPNSCVGDSIIIETNYGENYRYVVSYSDVVYNDEDEEYWYGFLDKNTLEPVVVPYEKSKDLELFTCTDEWGMNYRYLVRAYLADGVILCD